MQPNRIHMHLISSLYIAILNFTAKKNSHSDAGLVKISLHLPKCQKPLSLIYIIEEQLWNGQTGKLYSTAELMMSKQMS